MRGSARMVSTRERQENAELHSPAENTGLPIVELPFIAQLNSLLGTWSSVFIGHANGGGPAAVHLNLPALPTAKSKAMPLLVKPRLVLVSFVVKCVNRAPNRLS